MLALIGALPQETQRLMAEPVPGISAKPDESNARYFHVVVAGGFVLMRVLILETLEVFPPFFAATQGALK